MSSESTLLIFSSLLFCIGLALLLNRKNLVHLLIGIELMLNSANVNLVYFSKIHGEDGVLLVVFLLLIAVCEAAVGLAIFLRAYRFFQSSSATMMKNIRES